MTFFIPSSELLLLPLLMALLLLLFPLDLDERKPRAVAEETIAIRIVPVTYENFICISLSCSCCFVTPRDEACGGDTHTTAGMARVVLSRLILFQPQFCFPGMMWVCGKRSNHCLLCSLFSQLAFMILLTLLGSRRLCRRFRAGLSIFPVGPVGSLKPSLKSNNS